jgi:WD40 repeat protein
MSVRRVFLIVALPVLFLAVLGGMIFSIVYSQSSPRDDLVTPHQVISIPLSTEPSLLAWSADGKYIAAGTGYSPGMPVSGPAKVFLIEVGKQAVAATVDTAARIDALAFSPDGKWLAAATGVVNDSADLLVLTVPDFTLKTKLKSRGEVLDDKRRWPTSFVDIAWAPDSKTLHAIDGFLAQPPQFRRWTPPDFGERPAITNKVATQTGDAIAVAPNGRSLCYVESRVGGSPGVLHLFDLATGAQAISIENVPHGRFRAAFTADGKSVGVFSGIEVMPIVSDIFDSNGKNGGKHQTMSWWDVATGQPTTPTNPRFAVQPAAQAESRYFSIAPDSRIWAHSLNLRQPGKDGRLDEDGRYVALTRTDTTKGWRWRFGNTPSLAFSPDSRKLAGTLKTQGGWTVAIWTVS